MNSAQRRKAKRGHPYAITIEVASQQRYFEHDEKVYQAVGWCAKHCEGTWRNETNWDHAVFKFSNQKDATYFALKWT